MSLIGHPGKSTPEVPGVAGVREREELWKGQCWLLTEATIAGEQKPASVDNTVTEVVVTGRLTGTGRLLEASEFTVIGEVVILVMLGVAGELVVTGV